MSVDWSNFTPLASLGGGALLGLSATVLLWLHGRIAGITGIVSGAVDPETRPRERIWRLAFLAGLLAAAAGLALVVPDRFELGIERSPVVLVAAGILVGIGTRLGSGCTSGHGVCGISRGSMRSLAATGTFMLTGFVTVFVYRQITGGV